MEINLTARLSLLEHLVFSVPVELLGNCIATYHDDAVRCQAARWLDEIRRLREFEDARQRERAEQLRQLINREPFVDVVYGEDDYE